MNKIIEVALNEIGETEYPFGSNCNKYGTWFGLNGVRWCGIFVSWVYAHAGFRLPHIGFTKGFASCQMAFDHFNLSKELTVHPSPGDIVLFDFNHDSHFDHCGIFLGPSIVGCFDVIEGNTSFRNQTNGGSVMQRSRYVKDAVFVHPKILDK